MPHSLRPPSSDVALFFELDQTLCKLTGVEPLISEAQAQDQGFLEATVANAPIWDIDGRTHHCPFFSSINYGYFKSLFDKVEEVNTLSGRRVIRLIVLTDADYSSQHIMANLCTIYANLKLDGYLRIDRNATKHDFLTHLHAADPWVGSLDKKRIVLVDTCYQNCRSVQNTGFSAVQLCLSPENDRTTFEQLMALVNSVPILPSPSELSTESLS